MGGLGTNLLAFDSGQQFPARFSGPGPFSDFCSMTYQGQQVVAHLSEGLTVFFIDAQRRVLGSASVPDPSGMGFYYSRGVAWDGRRLYVALSDVTGRVGYDLVVVMEVDGRLVDFWPPSAVGAPGLARQLYLDGNTLFLLQVDETMGFGTFVSRYTKGGVSLGTAHLSTDLYSGIVRDGQHWYLTNESLNQVERRDASIGNLLGACPNPDEASYSYSGGLSLWHGYLYTNQA